MAKTPEGYLICYDVNIARIGTQEYLGRELGVEDEVVVVNRPPEEVFKPATVASFEGKPFTNDHPYQLLDISNTSIYQKGHVQNVRISDDKTYIIADIIVQDEQTIRDIENGKRELSAGYNCDCLQDENGNWYQCNIIGNHVALVDKGRAGEKVRINDNDFKEAEHPRDDDGQFSSGHQELVNKYYSLSEEDKDIIENDGKNRISKLINESYGKDITEQSELIAGELDCTGYVGNSNNSQRINNMLRAGQTPKEYVDTEYSGEDEKYRQGALNGLENTIKALDNNMKVIDEDLELVRYDNDFFGLDIDEESVGKTFTNKAYTSTSAEKAKNVFTNRNYITNIKVPKGSKALVTSNTTESEVILPRESKFKIESVKPAENANFIIDVILLKGNTVNDQKKEIESMKTQQNVLGKLFKAFAKDAEPEEILEAVKAVQGEDEEPVDRVAKLEAQVAELTAKLEKLYSAEKQEEQGEMHALDELEEEIKDECGAEEVKDEEEPKLIEAQEETAQEDEDTTEEIKKEIADAKKVIAKIADTETRLAVADSLAKVIRGKMKHADNYKKLMDASKAKVVSDSKAVDYNEVFKKIKADKFRK
jgi:hypothetical protein